MGAQPLEMKQPEKVHFAFAAAPAQPALVAVVGDD
jgi:hypothetical protein